MKKIALNKESLRKLEDDQLDRANGGAQQTRLCCEPDATKAELTNPCLTSGC